MEKIAVAVVGLGRIASLLEDDPLREKPCTHIGAVCANDDCTLVAGTDLDESRRALFEERWGCPSYASADVMLQTHDVRILIIATHPDSHADYCVLASKYNVPVVICEKPLSDSLEGAQRIAALHKSGVVKVITNHERRYSADYIEAKNILAEKHLGELLSARAVLYMGINRRLIDVFWHDGTHLIDAVMFLTGLSLRYKKKWGARLTCRDGTAFLLGDLCGEISSNKEKSVPFLFELGSRRDHLVFELEFSCERGRLRIGNGVFEVWNSDSCPYAEGFRSLKKEREGFIGKTGYFANMIADAVACVRNPEHNPHSSAINGLEVISFLSAPHPRSGF